MIQLLTDQSVSGWDTFPVEVSDRNGKPLAGYLGLAVTGNECERVWSLCEMIQRPATAYVREQAIYRGLYFDETEWDGSDMFWVKASGRAVTEEGRRAFREARVTNVQLIPLPEVETLAMLRDYYPGADQ